MTAHRATIRRTALTATAVLAALALSACGSDGHAMGSMESDSAPTASVGGHNTADVSFSTEMIQHHRQAIDMAALVDNRASSQDVKDLATKIEAAQDPEIETMSGWLTAWGEKLPEDMSGSGHDMTSAMPGMMSGADMDKLESASGTEFDKMFLDMMVQHHEGAIEMAKTERTDGEYGPATRLADDVVTAQTAEIGQMNGMLGQS